MPTRPSQKAVALVMLNEVTAQGQAPTRERFAIVCIALGREVAGELAVGPRKTQEIIHRITTKHSTGFYMLKDVPPE
ncbi:MAG: hypothetical protein ACI8P2_002018 [Candidatus Latescibacterota bacterium]|jgi:hypothetical protein